DELIEVGAFDILHDQKQHIVHLVGVVGHDDVGVIQLRGGQHFAAKPAAGLAVLDQLGRNHLQGDDSIHDAVARFVDAAEAAPAQDRKSTRLNSSHGSISY